MSRWGGDTGHWTLDSRQQDTAPAPAPAPAMYKFCVLETKSFNDRGELGLTAFPRNRCRTANDILTTAMEGFGLYGHASLHCLK